MGNQRGSDTASPAEEVDSFEQPDVHLCEVVHAVEVEETKAEWTGFMQRMAAVR